MDFKKANWIRVFYPIFDIKEGFTKGDEQAKGTHCKAFLPSFSSPYTHGRLTFEVALFSGLYRISGTIRVITKLGTGHFWSKLTRCGTILERFLSCQQCTFYRLSIVFLYLKYTESAKLCQQYFC